MTYHGIFSNKNGNYDTIITFEKNIINNIQQYNLIAKSNSNIFILNLKNCYSTFINNILPSTKLNINNQNESIQIQFNSLSDAKEVHEFICNKSIVHQNNDLIDSLDKSIEQIWPLPGGMFI